MPSAVPEPEVGEYVTEHGANIPHIMRPGYVGKKVIVDRSTQSHRWYQCGILEQYTECRGVMRSIVNIGKKDPLLIDHWPGTELFECLPYNAYTKRMSAIGNT